jgi:hypothetical protein
MQQHRHFLCRPAATSRWGMTMVEVSIALAILTIAIGSLVSFAGTQSMARSSTEGQTQAAELARALSERLQSARWEWLGTNRLPWSYGRYVDGSGHGPMTLTDTDSADNLRTLGLVPRQLDLPNLQVYFEWYRGLDALDDAGLAIATEPGVLSSGATTTGAFRSLVRVDPADNLSAFKTVYRPALDGASWTPGGLDSPTAFVQAGMPLVARIVVRWGLDSVRTIEVITARSP